ncbi:MAG: AMP-binding protein [Nocardioides sp.]|nr:AMP-binding protein [Nocardioides sp.]
MHCGYFPWDHLGPDPKQAEQVVLRDDHQTLAAAGFAERVDAFAGQLQEAGVRHGDVVAVMLPNRIELVVALFAAWRLGAAVTPVNPTFTPREADHQINNAGATVVVNLDALAPDAGKPTIHVAQMATRAPEAPGAELPAPVTSMDDLALVAYTTGSFGEPRGVMLSHGNLVAAATQLGERLAISPEDHSLLILPAFHSKSIVVNVLTPMLAGAAVSLSESFDPESFVELVADIRPTYFSAVPTVFSLLASLPAESLPDTSSLRFAIGGSALVSQEVRVRVEERLGLMMVDGYGVTENTCVAACNPADRLRKTGSVGPGLPGQRLRIVDNHGNDLPAGEEGAILMAGPTVMQGYRAMPAETAAAVVDGWLRTGDRGRLDEDGYLILVEPDRESILCSGENLCPTEIEKTLREVHDVFEVAVTGRPDPVHGQVPVAFVALKPTATVTSDSLLAHCRSRLPQVKVPVEITVVEDLPAARSGEDDAKVIGSPKAGAWAT